LPPAIVGAMVGGLGAGIGFTMAAAATSAAFFAASRASSCANWLVVSGSCGGAAVQRTGRPARRYPGHGSCEHVGY
jgi:hypothetical protein